MFSVSDISNSLISSILYKSKDTSSTEDSDTSSNASNLNASDIVTLSSESMGLLEGLMNPSNGGASSLSSNSLDLLNTLYNAASGTDETATSDDSSNESQELLNVLLNSTVDASDTYGDSLYNVLLSSQNSKLIKNNPDFVNMFLATEETESTDSSSSDISSSADDINLVTMSAGQILKIIEKYREKSGSITASSLTDISV